MQTWKMYFFQPDFNHKGNVWICVNLSNATGYVTHNQFNIQQLYALPTLYLCVLY